MNQKILVLILICVSSLSGFAQEKDSLYAKRVFLTTHIYKDGLKLSNQRVNQLFKDTWQPRVKYKWSNILKPIGPVVAIGGVGIAYVALKGTDATATIEGKEVDYKIRSLPKLLMGLGLFVGGLSMVESSNELAQHSVDIYNSMLNKNKKTSHINKIKFGITDSYGLGFSVLLK
ncbi:MAG: hypothetical protein U5M51_07715 [Emticicia sp.]|nr:hypothetical protein [Emticicia sp.]